MCIFLKKVLRDVNQGPHYTVKLMKMQTWQKEKQ